MARAALSASSPNNPMSGNGLAVLGSAGSSAVTATVSATSAGGGVTTSANRTSSPVGLMAMIGASFNCTTTGSSTDLIGSATSRGISTAVKSTGVFVALASSMALAFGYT